MKSNKRAGLGNDRKQFKRTADFSTRAVKLRLFTLVCGVMIVLVLMFEARKPKNWDWMGFNRAEVNIDTRYLRNIYEPGDQGKRRQDKGRQDKAEESQTQSGTAEKAQDPANPFHKPEFVKAEKIFWDTAYRKLNYRQRMLLFEGLYLARNRRKLDPHQASEWLRISEEFSVSNDRYQADIIQFMGTLSEDDPERGLLNQTLFKLQTRWTAFKKVLESIGNPSEDVAVKPVSLFGLQEVIDRTAFGFVEDNSLQSFVNNQPPMFRLIERVKIEEPGSRADGVVEKVLFAQLYKETDRLRGKKVSFEGEIRAAYHFEPTANYLGIRKLYAFWIQVSGAQNPVVVYSLSVPAEFVVDVDKHASNDPGELKEKVKITGFLLQKMVYAAEDGQRIAPVIFTDVPGWIPKNQVVAGNRKLPGMTEMFGAFLGIGAFLAVVTWIFVSYNNQNHTQRIVGIKKRFEDSNQSESPDE